MDEQNTEALGAEFERLTQLFNSGAMTLEEYEKSVDDASKAAVSWTDITVKAAKNFAAGVAQTTKEIAAGNTKFSSLDKAVDGTTSALQDLAELSPVLKKEIKDTFGTLGDASKFLLDQLQKQVDIFQQMSATGATESLEQLQQQFYTSGLKLETFAKEVSENSKALAMFRGMTADGADAFAEITGQLTQTDDSLRRLNMNAEDIGDATAKYISQQSRLGRAQSMTNQELANSAKNYLLELDLLSKVTGQSRKEMQQLQEKLLTENRWRANLYKMDREGNKLGADRLKEVASALGDTNLGKGFRDMLGGVNTKEAGELFRVMPEAKDVMEQLKNGTMTTEQALERLGKGAVAAEGKTANLFSVAPEAARDAYGEFHEIADLARKFTEGSFDKAKQMQDRQESGANAMTEEAIKGQKNLESYHRELQKLTFKAFPMMTKSVEAATEALDVLAKKINEELGQPATWRGEGAEQQKSGLLDTAADYYDRTKRAFGFGGTTEKQKPTESFNQNAPTLMKNLMSDFKLTKEQAAGIVGNLAHESGGLQAGIQEKNPLAGRGGLGWAQWTGSRRNQFEDYLKRTGQQANDPNANYGFLKQELTTDPRYRATMERVRESKSANDAMMVFEKGYEGAGIKHYESRQKWANTAMGLDVNASSTTGSMSNILDQAEQFKGKNETKDAQELTNYLNQHSGTTFKSVAGTANAWCARFVNATLDAQGIKGTGTASATDFKNYGEGVDSQNARQGDIAVLNSGGTTGSGSHVAFIKNIDHEKGTVTVVGGNQGGEKEGGGGVTESVRKISDLQSIRRAPGATGETAMAMAPSVVGGSSQIGSMNVNAQTVTVMGGLQPNPLVTANNESPTIKVGASGDLTTAAYTPGTTRLPNINTDGLMASVNNLLPQNKSTLGGPSNHYNSPTSFSAMEEREKNPEPLQSTEQTNDLYSRSIEILTAQNDKLDSLISLMKSQVNTSDKMLKATV